MEFSNTNQRTKRGVNSDRILPQIELWRFFINSTYDLWQSMNSEINFERIQRTELAGEEKTEYKTMTIHAHF